MNTYRRERDLPPFLLERCDLDALCALLSKLLPPGEAQHEWQSVSSDLDRVQVDEADLDSFLENSELPETLSNLVVAVHKTFSLEQPRSTYSIRVSLYKSWAKIMVDGPDEAWVAGASEQVLAFFSARKRRFGRFMQALTRTGPWVLMLPAGGLVSVAFASWSEDKYQVALLALVSVLALLSASGFLLFAKGGDVTRIRLAGSKRAWSASFVLTAIACGFTILTFIVAVLQLLKS